MGRIWLSKVYKILARRVHALDTILSCQYFDFLVPLSKNHDGNTWNFILFCLQQNVFLRDEFCALIQNFSDIELERAFQTLFCYDFIIGPNFHRKWV